MGRNVVYSVFKSSEGSGRRPSLPEEQLSLATAGRLRRDCIYIELGHQLDRVLGIQASQTDQQTAVWRLRFKGKSLDSYKSQTDTPASVTGLSSWHTLVQIKTLYVSVTLTPAGDDTCPLSCPLPGYRLWYCDAVAAAFHPANNLSHSVLAGVMRGSEYQNHNEQHLPYLRVYSQAQRWRQLVPKT